MAAPHKRPKRIAAATQQWRNRGVVSTLFPPLLNLRGIWTAEVAVAVTPPSLAASSRRTP